MALQRVRASILAAEARKAEGAIWTVLLIPRQPDRTGSDAYDGIESTSLPTSIVKQLQNLSPFSGQCDSNCICIWHTNMCIMIECKELSETCFKRHLAYQNTNSVNVFSLYILNFQV